MRLRQWVRPPHHLLLLFVAVTGIMAATLAWVGWRLVEQDRALERQQVRDRLESAADLVAAALVRSVGETDAQLARLIDLPFQELVNAAAGAAADPADEAALVVLRPDGVDIASTGRLPYVPVAPVVSPASDVFARGEVLEFQQRDLQGAIAVFRGLARSDVPAIRAGALLRLARALRKARRDGEALAIYADLAALGPIAIEGLPAALLARHARCALLDALGRRAELHAEAGALDEDLRTARWRVTRAAYYFYTSEVRRWRGGGPEPARDGTPPVALAMSEALETLWSEWQSRRRDFEGHGRRSLWILDQPVQAFWRGAGDRLVLLLAGRGHLERRWIAAAESLLARQRVRLTLTDVEGRRVRGTGDARPSPQTIVRTATETRLPWTLYLASADPGGELEGLATRRRLLLAALATIGVFVLMGTALIARAITRELEVARVQKDFVSAVSHEFRTPLASILQLSELLADGRVPSDARRQEYYGRLQRESERLHRLVETLLDFGRIEAGAREYRFEALDPAALVRAVGDEFGQKVAERGYRVEIAVNGSLPPIRADRAAVALGLWNLLDNAVKYSPASTTVWLEAERVDGRVAIRVRDQGLGIAPSERKQIFKKFVRAASAQAAGVKGTGLGLAMVHHIVMAHGGRIHVDSTPGAGSTFTLTFPALRGNAELPVTKTSRWRTSWL